MPRQHVWIVMFVLLFVSWLRIRHLVSFVEWPDEIWSVWHAQGTFSEAISRVPADWPPLFSAIIWGWQQLVGKSLEAARYLSVLFSVLALSFVYRAALLLNLKRADRPSIALLAALIYGVMAYHIFAGVDVRAYGLAMMLGALGFWLTLRWARNPSLKTGILLSLVLAGLVYSTYTSVIFVTYLALVATVLRPRAAVRWMIVGGAAAILTLPLIPSFASNAGLRLDVMNIPKYPFVEQMMTTMREFTGSDGFGLALLLAAGLAIWLAIHSRSDRLIILLLVAGALFPVFAYFTATSREFMKPRYQWWVGIALVMLAGYALAYMPRLVRWGIAAILIIAPFFPVDWFSYRMAVTTSPPFRDTFSWLERHLRPGDVIVIDPQCTCGEPTGWDYFAPQYFLTGELPIVDRPGEASRVWYLSTDGWERDEGLFAEVQNGRKPSIFVGPWYFLLRLYEGPPSWTGVHFGEEIRLHGVETSFTGEILRENQSVQVKLWWSTDRQLDRDYSFSVAVINESGAIIAQQDGPARAPDTPAQTSAWIPGTYYEDFRSLHLPIGTQSGQYRLVVTVYKWWENGDNRLSPESNQLFPLITEDNYLVVKQFEVVSY